MALGKVTFTLDGTTLALIRDAADRLSLPKSQIVRQAVREYHENLERLSSREKADMLRAFDEFLPNLPPRKLSEVARELADIRAARRSRGRRSSVEPE